MVCVIVGSMPEEKLFIPPNSFIIAADKGFEQLQKRGITPHLTVGDFDSLGYVPQCENLVRHPVQKDDTDMLLAVREGLKRGYKKFILYGGIGGRLDHTFANIQTLAFLKKSGASAVLYGEDTAIMLIEDESVSFSCDESGYVSVFSYGGKAFGVSEKGLKYSLSDAEIDDTFPIGVSNEFIGQKSEISVKNGRLLIVYKTDPKNAIKQL
ncbi:MAG: thiamine diphosphokinase [Clostridia bacterium]|nr:thiamine diphosphokinase [Clostridia bacterium]